MAVEVRNFDSQTYRKLFEFIRREGIEPFAAFLQDYMAIKSDDLILDALTKGRHRTLSLVRKHRVVSNFLKELNVDNAPCLLANKNLLEFVDGLDIDKLSVYIEGARCLEDLKVGSITLISDMTQYKSCPTIVYYEGDGRISDVVKHYANGEIVYQVNEEDLSDSCVSYHTMVDFPADSSENFVISAENHASGFQYRYARVSGFGFDTSLLPNEAELASYELPKSLTESKVYIRR